MKEIGNIKLVYTSSEFGFKLGKPNNDRHQSGSPTGVVKIGGGSSNFNGGSTSRRQFTFYHSVPRNSW